MIITTPRRELSPDYVNIYVHRGDKENEDPGSDSCRSAAAVKGKQGDVLTPLRVQIVAPTLPADAEELVNSQASPTEGEIPA